VESFSESIRLGWENIVPLTKLNLLIGVFFIASVALVSASKITQTATSAAYALFIASRLIQAVVQTYFALTNPFAYLSARVKNTGTQI